MSTKPETWFYTNVHTHLARNVYRLKNNNPYVGGIPDCYYSGNRADLWVEYKFLPRTPLRASVWLVDPEKKEPLLSKLQQNWLNDRYAEGRTVAVVVGCPDGGIILRDQEWEREIPPDAFRDRLLPRKAIAQWITDTTTR